MQAMRSSLPSLTSCQSRCAEMTAPGGLITASGPNSGYGLQFDRVRIPLSGFYWTITWLHVLSNGTKKDSIYGADSPKKPPRSVFQAPQSGFHQDIPYLLPTIILREADQAKVWHCLEACWHRESQARHKQATNHSTTRSQLMYMFSYDTRTILRSCAIWPRGPKIK